MLFRSVLNQLGQTVFERAKQERGGRRRAERLRLLTEAADWFERVLKIDPENVTAHYNLSLVYDLLGDAERAGRHRSLHAKYKPDDNARDSAIAAARRRYPAANHAAEAVVIYDLQRPGAFDWPEDSFHMAGRTPGRRPTAAGGGSADASVVEGK